MSVKQGKILIIDDNHDILLTAKVVLKKLYGEIITEDNPEKIKDLFARNSFDVVLLDMNFSPGEISGKEGIKWLKTIKKLDPLVNVIIITAYGDIDLAVKAMKEGALDFVVKPWDNKKLIATVSSAFKFSKSQREISNLISKQQVLSTDLDRQFSEIITDSDVMKGILTTIEKVSKTDANVLILGKNGTGKEVIAREIHRQSLRSGKIFISVDLGAISESLFESELFGHVKGAFTDAKENRPGRFEIASGGTLFLDEIGNLSLPLQMKLLSVLQNREIQRIGSNEVIPFDVRLICATNMPLNKMIEENKFRQDLLYRINTVEIKIPTLKERPEDLPLLAKHFLKEFSKKYHKPGIKLSNEALKKMLRYTWPGNIRELRHVVERAVIMSEANILKADDFALNINETDNFAKNELNLEEIEKEAINTAMLKHKGNLSNAAKELGLGRTTLYRKISKYGL
ncbi:sigma-54-dependent transcriptional regulator [Bacteroidota bacterium]